MKSKKFGKYVSLATLYALLVVITYTLMQVIRIHYIVSAVVIIGGVIMVADIARYVFRMRHVDDKDTVMYVFHYVIAYTVVSALCVSLLFSRYIMVYSVTHAVLFTYGVINYGERLSDAVKQSRK